MRRRNRKEVPHVLQIRISYTEDTQAEKVLQALSHVITGAEVRIRTTPGRDGRKKIYIRLD